MRPRPAGIRAVLIALLMLVLIAPTTAAMAGPEAPVDPGPTATEPAEPTESAETPEEKKSDEIGGDEAVGDAVEEKPEPTQVDQPAEPAVRPYVEAQRADEPARGRVGITKETNLADGTLSPGQEFVYIITVRCSGLTVGCVGQSLTDVLPEGLDVTSLPQTTDGRTVEFDQASRTLQIDFTEALQEPVGAIGLNDGATRVIEIGMRLPAGSTLPEGSTIANSATTQADNADPAEDDVDVVVSIPREVVPIATKTWADGSAVAGSGEESEITLGVRNGSSGSVLVEELRVTDDTPATYEHFDLVDVEVTRFPAGADRAQLWVCTAASPCDADDYVAGAVRGDLGQLGLPAGVSAGQVTGFQVRFSAADGSPLPYDATGGTVVAAHVLRDEARSTGEPIRPTQKITINNCAVPTAVDGDGEATNGSAACAVQDILPDTVLVEANKSYFADTNGNYSQQDDEYAVLGEDSAVSATIKVTNRSAFPLGQIRIVEPDENAAVNEFDKLDVSEVRLRLPAGATGAVLSVEYDDPALNTTTSYDENVTVDVERPGARVTRIEVVYTGEDDGEPSIAIDATGWLDLHGTLNSQVTSDDLPNEPSAGVHNCAAYEARAQITNSTGAAAGNVCDTLQIQVRRHGGDGVKTIGQGDIPEGQPIPFTLELRNSGNVPLVNPVITDPVATPSGAPSTTNNPFDVLRLVSAAIRKDAGTPDVALEVYDSQASSWVAYDAADTALLTRATGVRAVVDGPLTPGKRIYLDLVTQRRDGVPNGTLVHNCFSAAAQDWVTAEPICSASVETGPGSSAAVINKSISPGELPRPLPGVPEQTAEVRTTVANIGNVNASRLQVTDADADFFDAVRFGGIRSVTFPVGADRIQIDVRTTGSGATWIEGERRGSGASYPLPDGVEAAEVVALRFTFTHSSDEYRLRPCEGEPTPASCTGAVVFDVHPLAESRSTGEPIPDELNNRIQGGFETFLHQPGSLQPIEPAEATLDLVEGDPRLRVSKTPNTAISPGETAPFELTVTNTGTANLPGLVVRDELPAGLEFDETYVGDGGQPFRIVGVEVPEGTEALPTPEFVTHTDGSRVSGLEWSFGDWVLRPGSRFTIQIQVRLAPGVTEGLVNTNIMGATAEHPELVCQPGGDPDDVFGDGVWCTDTAEVTTKAGAAFQARKWVAGNDALGWFNDRSGLAVPVGDATCPSYAEAGRTYTAFPCVALVNPGDEYDYLLRMVNAGTEPATEMRIVDRFPVAGDKGVVLDDVDRGTEWDNRPTLASEPVLIGAGALQTTYADSEAGVCVAALEMNGACGPESWADSFSAQAVAAQMRVDWETPLAPGEGVGIAFSMRTPLQVAQVGSPTIAWNSFGHAEKTVRGSGSRTLPPTEPIQVGVATAYGTLDVSKEITANPGDLPVTERSYPIEYRCTSTPIGADEQVVASGSLGIVPGESSSVTGIPAGATCEVWETDAFGGVSNHPTGDPAIVTITPQLGTEPGPAVTVSIENSFPLAELSVEKSVTGAAAVFGESTAFQVEVTCTMDGVTATGYPQTVTLLGNDSATLEAPVGSRCTAVETQDGGATETTVTPVDGVLVTAEADAELLLEVENEFRAGQLQILKLLSGAGSDLASGPFEFEVACTFQGNDLDPITVTIPRSGNDRELVAGVDAVLPIGAECLVTETDSGGADETPAPVLVTIVENDEENTVRATFTNEFSAGTLSLGKVLEGAGAESPWATEATFVLDVTCAVGEPTNVLHSQSISIRGGERLPLLGADEEQVLLPLGTRCWAEESGTGGATDASVDADSWEEAVEVTSGSPEDLQELSITATNTFDLTSLSLVKVLAGEGARYVVDREFTVEVSCVLPQDGIRTPVLTDEVHVLRADEPVTIEKLPVGAECWAVETDAGGADASEVEHGDATTALPLVAGAESRIEVLNTFEVAELSVDKVVVGPGTGRFDFTLVCTTGQGAVPLDEGDASFQLAADEVRTIVVPEGAECRVEETGVDDEVTVSVTDSDGQDDGVVTVLGAASVTVTNTFPEEPTVGPNDESTGPRDSDPDSDSGSNGGGGLPNTGGPALIGLLAALALLGAGAGLLVHRRRGSSGPV